MRTRSPVNSRSRRLRLSPRREPNLNMRSVEADLEASFLRSMAKADAVVRDRAARLPAPGPPKPAARLTLRCDTDDGGAPAGGDRGPAASLACRRASVSGGPRAAGASPLRKEEARTDSTPPWSLLPATGGLEGAGGRGGERWRPVAAAARGGAQPRRLGLARAPDRRWLPLAPLRATAAAEAQGPSLPDESTRASGMSSELPGEYQAGCGHKPCRACQLGGLTRERARVPQQGEQARPLPRTRTRVQRPAAACRRRCCCCQWRLARRGCRGASCQARRCCRCWQRRPSRQ